MKFNTNKIRKININNQKLLCNSKKELKYIDTCVIIKI